MRRIYMFGVLGLAVLVTVGWTYGILAKKYDAISKIPLFLPVPLDNFPLILGDWNGRDMPISETVLKVAGNDDYLSRYYVNSKVQAGATLYVGYTTEPRRMLGHRPQVCYVGSGWTHDYTNQEAIRTVKGNEQDCLIHRFYKPGLSYEEVFVLNYYIVNGHITTNQKDFESLRWRRPKQVGGQIQYVAQIQISSASEQAVRVFGQEVGDLIMEYMP